MTIGVWDRSSGLEAQHLDFDTNVNSIELSRDGNVLTVTNGFNVTFFETETLKKLKEITVPTRLSSASLHPDKMVFVCGGEDFKMYKYDYLTGNEIGKYQNEVFDIISHFFHTLSLTESFKGHFGAIYSIKFSPDGELYASGSEDGTLRLWQTTVGKNYGLWKCVNAADSDFSLSAPREVTAN